jgi:hypothetical protein
VASRPFDVQAKARDFADTLSGVLNGTVCRGVRLSPVLAPGGGTVWVGYNITKTELTGSAFPLGIPKSSIFCGLSYRLQPDDEDRFLMVASSFMGLFLDAEMETPLLHFDYERDKGDGYPEAHLQVHAGSAAWDQAIAACPVESDRKRDLAHLHLPVGGRRLRPTLEDLIEFVIAERLVRAKSGWLTVLDRAREPYAINQMRAMIRRYPDEAGEAVREFTTAHPTRRG